MEPPPRATIQVAPPAQTAAPPLQPGRLFVNASPWGELYVDGQFIGNTPMAGEPVTYTHRQFFQRFLADQRQVNTGQVRGTFDESQRCIHQERGGKNNVCAHLMASLPAVGTSIRNMCSTLVWRLSLVP